MFGFKGSSLYKRGKYWVLQYKVGDKTKQKSLKTQIKVEAEERAMEFLRLLQADNKVSIIKEIAKAKKIDIKRIELADVWEIYLQAPDRSDPSETTLKSYSQYWEQFLENTEKKYIDEIDQEEARRFCSYLLSTNIKPQTYNKKKNFLTSLFSTMSHEAGLLVNPFRDIPNKRPEKAQITELEEVDVKNLINSSSVEEKALFSLGAYAGCRLKDACLMEWSSVDLNSLIIKFQPAKTKRISPHKYISLPILPDLEKALRPLLGKDNKYIIPRWAHLYLHERSVVQQSIKRLMKASGINMTGRNGKTEGVRGFHAFRHYFVSYCAKSGVPFAVVQALVGHGSPAMTREYTHIDVETARTALVSNDDALKVNNIRSILKTMTDLELKDKILNVIDSHPKKLN